MRTLAEIYAATQGLSDDGITHTAEIFKPQEGYFDKFPFTIEWLSGFTKTQRINPWISSYGLKHVFEGIFRSKFNDSYLPNGVFIAAAIEAGFRYSSIKTGRFNKPTLNCSFNLGKKAVIAWIMTNIPREQWSKSGIIHTDCFGHVHY